MALLVILLYCFICWAFYYAKNRLSTTMRKTLTKDHHYDWDAKYEDIKNGVSHEEQMKKEKRGDYWTDKPINDLKDMKRFEHDKAHFGEAVAEDWKRRGYYRFYSTYTDYIQKKKVNNDPDLVRDIKRYQHDQKSLVKK